MVSAGWIETIIQKFYLKNTKNILATKELLSQYEAIKLSEKVDYIICVYEPKNDNSINASPNKIYDAIQVQTPVIINSEGEKLANS